jgi:hypothetical protein
VSGKLRDCLAWQARVRAPDGTPGSSRSGVSPPEQPGGRILSPQDQTDMRKGPLAESSHVQSAIRHGGRCSNNCGSRRVSTNGPR